MKYLRSLKISLRSPKRNLKKNLEVWKRLTITTIDEAMLQRTWQEIEYRLDVLRATNGAHIEVY